MKVLLLVARGLHLGHLGCYGNLWAQTPVLDRLAAEGIVFDQHLADRPDHAGARHALRTGHYSFPTVEADPASTPEAVPDLLAVLRGHGVATAQLARGPWPAPAALRKELRRLATLADGLLWVELTSLLPPWNVPEQFLDSHFQSLPAKEEEDGEPADEELLEPLLDPIVGRLVDDPDDTTFRRLQRSYASAVTYLDDRLGALLESVPDEVLLLLTTDHGLALGEHGIVGLHRPWLHDELIHLPLMVRLPGGAEAGRRVPYLTQPVDLMPTLLDLFELPIPPVQGKSLLPLLRGKREPIRAYACSGLQVGETVEWALRTPDWAFLLPVRPAPDDPPRSPQLYVKPDDRWEVNNVVQHHLELAEHLEQTLRGFVKAAGRPGPVEAPVFRDVEAELAGAPVGEAPP